MKGVVVAHQNIIPEKLRQASRKPGLG